jgi:2-polyprenyl-3-methyl-5-hydroxy-6-metoxy-1,4-benzoquinol methylase
MRLVKLPPIRNCDRIEYILAACEGNTVLHVGCADWPFTQAKLDADRLLHPKIHEVAQRLSGIDLSTEGVAVLKQRGFGAIVVHDATKSLWQQFGRSFDVVIAGETIEHVPNAGDFLESIKTVLRPDSVLVLTTPNFCPIKRISRLAYRNEVVNDDHLCYYSRATLGMLMERCGYEVIDWKSHWWDSGALSKLVNPILRRIPFLQYYADTLCITAKLRP